MMTMRWNETDTGGKKKGGGYQIKQEKKNTFVNLTFVF